jgi:crotonobetainyl-CoA:carnitine CoA-transferase CaiB-like acyl-CoA transferase
VSRDGRFANAETRAAHAAAVVEALDTVLRRRTAGEWMERWRRLGIAASPVGTLADLAEDPQAWANDYFVEAYCEEVKRTVKVRGLPIGLAKTPGVVRTLGPELGEHTELILAETLGYSWDEIGTLKEQGVIP